ncbi:MAG: hypothetical protein AAFR57_03260 [Pseudomonadota bacterium]
MRDIAEQVGWEVFPAEEAVRHWVQRTEAWVSDYFGPDPDRGEWRHGGTWFPGVNILPNDGAGALTGGPPLEGAAALAALQHEPDCSAPWDRGQISICRPGYPAQDTGESDSAHRFRRDRDAAHLDGLLPVGAARRRHMQERHAAILGLPLNAAPATAAPFVVYEGSHRIMQDMLKDAFRAVNPSDWGAVDVTDAYQAARREVFASCPRRPIQTKPGEAFVIHRFTLHGVAPWTAASTEERRIAYFRPETGRSPHDWLEGP